MGFIIRERSIMGLWSWRTQGRHDCRKHEPAYQVGRLISQMLLHVWLRRFHKKRESIITLRSASKTCSSLLCHSFKKPDKCTGWSYQIVRLKANKNNTAPTFIVNFWEYSADLIICIILLKYALFVLEASYHWAVAPAHKLIRVVETTIHQAAQQYMASDSLPSGSEAAIDPSIEPTSTKKYCCSNMIAKATLA